MSHRTQPHPFPTGARLRHAHFGTGVVIANEGQLVRVRFDDGAISLFNIRNPYLPIERMLWQPGAEVLVRSTNALGTVVDATIDDGLVTYRVRYWATGVIAMVPEAGLDDAPAADDPDERLRRGQFDTCKQFYFKTMGHYLACAGERLSATSIAARVVPMPHQIFVAHRVVSAPRQRFLLADEVGLGKTIETGLILQELRARGGLERVLIIVPPTLTIQWLYELRAKFNEEFALYTSDRLRQIAAQHPGENVWTLERDIICAHSVITNREDEWDDMLAVPWDMVVVDEAHHVRRQRDRRGSQTATKLYQFINLLSQRTRGLLFLTATPMQLDPFELYSMVELLDPALYYSFDAFAEQLERNRDLNAVIKKLAEIDQLNPDERRTLSWEVAAFLDGDDDTAARIERITTSQIARDNVIERLTEQHLLSEVMVRNRKRLVGQFTRRVARIIPVELSQPEIELYQVANAYIRQAYLALDERQRGFAGFMLAGYQKRLTSSLFAFRRSLERRLENLQARALTRLRLPSEGITEIDTDTLMLELERAVVGDSDDDRTAEIEALETLLRLTTTIPNDSKYLVFERYVAQILDASPDESILVFSQFVDTLEFLKERLAARWPVATFHGRMRPREKDAAIASFRAGTARILLSSEAGGEGRNLQHCANLVNYDLPWNPMKIEQRIGRLDRIGQTRDVQIYNFALEGTIEERVLDVLHHRINAFEDTVGGLDPIIGEMELDLHEIVLEAHEDEVDARLHAYADEIEARVEQARRADDAMRDFVLDQRSYDGRGELLFDGRERERLERHTNTFSKALLKHIGARIRPIGSDTFRVELGRELTVELPTLSKSIYQVTFNYQRAIDDPIVEYGSFSHPLFDALVDYATSGAYRSGKTAARTIESDAFAGFRGFQLNYLVTLRSARTFRRVMPIVIDLDGRPRSELVDLVLDSFDWQNQQIPFDPSHIEDWDARVERALEAGETLVERYLHEEVGRLRQRAATDYETERQRIERYCQHRECEGQRKLEHDKMILTRLRHSTRPEDHRILPIWERNVANATQHLEIMHLERARLLHELEQRQHVSFTSELISAAWIVVVPMGQLAIADDELGGS